MKDRRSQTYNWHSSRLPVSSGRPRCSRAKWLWLKLWGWSGFLQKWLWLLRWPWWQGIFCRSGSCLWYGLHVGERSRTWPCALPSTPSGRGTSPSCLSAELLQVTGQLSATCTCIIWEKSAIRSKNKTFYSPFFLTYFSLKLHQLTWVSFPATPGTQDSVIIEISHPDWMVDTLQGQIRGPRPHVFTQIQYGNICLVQQSHKALQFREWILLDNLEAKKCKKSESFLTHAVHDGVVFRLADLQLRSCAQQAPVIYQPADQEHLFGTESIHVSDTRLWKPPNCKES